MLAHSAYALLSNIAHNSNPNRNEDARDSAWAQRTAYTADISSVDVGRLRRICYDRAKDTAESFDDLFMAYEQLNVEKPEEMRKTPVVFGIYYFEEHDPNSVSLWGD